MEMNYPSKLVIRIDWSDLDVYGHVNNVAYIRYVQSARVQYIMPLELIEQFMSKKISIILASTNIQYLAPLFFPGEAFIETSIAFIKNSSFGFSHRIRNAEGQIVAEAQDVMVYYDFNNNEKVRIQDEMRAKVAAIENRSFDV
jgi:acyl-CoA thioester hydrolase